MHGKMTSRQPDRECARGDTSHVRRHEPDGVERQRMAFRIPPTLLQKLWHPRAQDLPRSVDACDDEENNEHAATKDYRKEAAAARARGFATLGRTRPKIISPQQHKPRNDPK